ncbi:hypothetical protein ABW19_dt0207464 [Dactylella cylindrospora]|nr:hypothetical protein ABW19_dt0207464 [Dactylella cylindrospora]
MQVLSFAEKQLFGGAITANVPSTWMDMSDLRQVPDNQECFIDPLGLATMIFEVNERVQEADDEAAVKFHLSDIFEESQYKIWQSRKLTNGEIPGLPDVPAYTALVTTPYIEQRRGFVFHHSQFVALAIVIMRLEKQKTDIVITVNMPHSFDEATAEKSLCRPGLEAEKGLPADYVWSLEGAAKPLRDCLQAIEESIKTLKIHDWDLFVQEDGN